MKKKLFFIYFFIAFIQRYYGLMSRILLQENLIQLLNWVGLIYVDDYGIEKDKAYCNAVDRYGKKEAGTGEHLTHLIIK